MSTIPEPQTPTQNLEQAAAPPAGTPLFSTSHKIIYGVLTGLCVIGFIWGFRMYRDHVDNYQMQLPRYAAERAIKALDEGNADLARQEVTALMADVPIRRSTGLFNRPSDEVMEGLVLRNRVTPLERLTGKLLAANQPEQAEDVAWKMMLEYHIASRTLEYVDLWEWMLYVKAVRQQWPPAFEMLKILSAIGIPRLRDPAQIEPDPVPVDPALYKNMPYNLPRLVVKPLNQYYQATAPEDYLGAASALLGVRDQVQSPAVRHQINDLIHQAYLKGNDPKTAHEFMGKVWGPEHLAPMENFWRNYEKKPDKVSSRDLLDREPTLLGMLWRDRPSSATMTLPVFLDTFTKATDPRIRIIDFNKLIRKDIGYFNLNNKLIPQGERVVLSQAIAATMPVQVTRPVYRVYIAYEATGALGIYPIMLVRINKGPYIPIYCDATRPDLAWFDVKLDGPATYDFEFVYLNDAAFYYVNKGIQEDRNLYLYRMALVQVPPTE